MATAVTNLAKRFEIRSSTGTRAGVYTHLGTALQELQQINAGRDEASAYSLIEAYVTLPVGS